MRLPVKIEPDRIRDSIVEVRFRSKLPSEVVVGLIFNALDETYSYTNKPQIPSNLFAQGRDVKISLPVSSLFNNSVIKFELSEGSIIFNCYHNYPGWGIYRAEIEKVLEKIQEIDVVENYERVGVRYISEYKGKDIREITKMNFSFGLPAVKSDFFAFNSQFRDEKLRVILNLSSTFPVTLDEEDESKQVAVIDIDVINELSPASSIGSLIECLDATHEKEKEVFFNILKESFLDSLNPKY